MFKEATSEGTARFTFSQELEAGPTLFDSLDGPTTDPCGPEAAPANRSPRRASGAGSRTSGTSGPRCTGSSASAALSASLVSRYRQLSDMAGSMEYVLTWSEKVTPAGRSYWQQRASARRTSDSGSTGWPTAKAEDSASTGSHRGNPDTLTSATRLAGWPSASSRDWKDSPGMATQATNADGSERTRLDQLPRAAQLAGWPTTTVGDERNPSHEASLSHEIAHNNLRGVVHLAGWASPQASDPVEGARTAPESPQKCLGRDMHVVPGPATASSSAETASSGGYLNPAFSAWLMGFPREWTIAGHSLPSRRRTRSRPKEPTRAADGDCSKGTATP